MHNKNTQGPLSVESKQTKANQSKPKQTKQNKTKKKKKKKPNHRDMYIRRSPVDQCFHVLLNKYVLH